MLGKPLLPTLRTKKRYVVYETLSDDSFIHGEIYNAVNNAYKECYGLFGIGESGIMDTRISKNNRGIIKINHKYVDNLKISMNYVKDINKKKVKIHAINVSGILKKAKTKL